MGESDAGEDESLWRFEINNVKSTKVRNCWRDSCELFIRLFLGHCISEC